MHVLLQIQKQMSCHLGEQSSITDGVSGITDRVTSITDGGSGPVAHTQSPNSPA